MVRIEDTPRTFEPADIETRLYREWESAGLFRAGPDPDRTPYCIVMPPPNITGQLHMGHALDNTLQDLLVRWRRMQGYSALWLPGTDHASIATEARIVEAMAKEGLTKDAIGRDAFLERAWEWKRIYGGRITEQLRRLGSSCDWERERFTMDEGLSNAVTEVFIRLYREGLVYRGERIINWCPRCLTSISDAEVEYEERDGSFWHIRYPLADGDGFLEVATTRPETMLGDTAVAVHPEDERYRHLVGRSIRLPLTNRVIPVIADDYVEMDFGTGAVKITPAHDPNDFEIGLRHGLPVVDVMTPDARMSEAAGPRYAGLDRLEARERVVRDLAEAGLLVRTRPHRHNVGSCYRCDTTVEPRVSFQWFVRMKPLAEPAIEAVRNGTVRFVPERFEKTYFNWMENIRDWCISRQLWWGHRIPAWHCQSCGRIHVGREAPDRCPDCGSDRFEQDPDTLDTWFSSALWPFSTLGWPERTPDLDYFYPTDVLVTGYDIIFFWVARMIFSGLAHMGERPFHTVLIHGIVRDAEGRKMSKSLGNGIDPLDIIDRFGADALRFSLVSGTAPGNDLRFSEEKAEAGRNLANKIWNAYRFVLMNLGDDPDLAGADPSRYTAEDRWILSRLNRTADDVTRNLERFEMGVALAKVVSLIRDTYCDWYIEMVKPRLFDRQCGTRTEALAVLCEVLDASMRLLHPFMPFLTEAVHRGLPGGEASIMTAAWPEYRPGRDDPEGERRMEILMEAVRGIRNLRVGLDVPPSRKAPILVVSADPEIRAMFGEGAGFLQRMASVSEVATQADASGIPPTAVSCVFPGGEAYIPLGGLIDLEAERTRLSREADHLEQECSRVRTKLDNPDFVGRAPTRVVEAERDKLARYGDMLRTVRDRLDALRDGS